MSEGGGGVGGCVIMMIYSKAQVKNDLHFAAFRRTCMHTEINFMPLHSAACTCIQISCTQK